MGASPTRYALPHAARALLECRRPTVILVCVARHFRWLALLICGAYLLLEARYVFGLPLVMDEFSNAGHIYRLAQHIPYRDYAPYKTVLGYYALLPALLAFADSWWAMLAVKLEIALLTALALWGAAVRLRRQLAPEALLGSLLLICTQSTFLERSAELRVDMLAALLGLVSLVAHLERRPLWAGMTVAGAVLVTQKGAYLVLALAASLLLQLLRERSRERLREVALTAAAAGGALAGYIVFWCAVGDPRSLWESMFVGPQHIAFDSLYDLNRYWFQTLSRNPVFYGIAALGLLLFAPRRLQLAGSATDAAFHSRLWAYSLALLALCVWHRQPWPYFFVLLIPTAGVLGAAVLSQLVARGRRWSLALGGIVLVGAISSLWLRVPVALARSSLAQQQTLRAAEAYLTPADTYVAGMELAWRHPHVAQLIWLDVPRLNALERDPSAALEELRATPPRLLIDNYRIGNLPQVIREQLSRSLWPVGGNLFCYAPELQDAAAVPFAHPGLYVVAGAAGSRVSVDGGSWLNPGDEIELSAGVHQTLEVGEARLVSWSHAPAFSSQVGRPSVNLFDQVYDY